MPGPWDDLFDVCSEWLAACEAAVATTDAGAIDRSFVSPGPPAWDCCPQLTVHGGYAIADTAPLIPTLAPGHRSTVQGGVVLVPLVATIIRCIPTLGDYSGSEFVPKAALEASAMSTHADLWAILNHTWDQHSRGILFAPESRELFFDPAVPLVPAGGCAGWQIQIRVSLYGYQESS